METTEYSSDDGSESNLSSVSDSKSAWSDLLQIRKSHRMTCYLCLALSAISATLLIVLGSKAVGKLFPCPSIKPSARIAIDAIPPSTAITTAAATTSAIATLVASSTASYIVTTAIATTFAETTAATCAKDTAKASSTAAGATASNTSSNSC